MVLINLIRNHIVKEVFFKKIPLNIVILGYIYLNIYINFIFILDIIKLVKGFKIKEVLSEINLLGRKTLSCWLIILDRENFLNSIIYYPNIPPLLTMPPPPSTFPLSSSLPYWQLRFAVSSLFLCYFCLHCVLHLHHKKKNEGKDYSFNLEMFTFFKLILDFLLFFSCFSLYLFLFNVIVVMI